MEPTQPYIKQRSFFAQLDVPATRRRCEVCKDYKDIRDFHAPQWGRGKLQPGKGNGRGDRCIACRLEYFKKWRRKNKRKVKEYNESRRERQRELALHRTYGITLDEYNAIFEKQGGVCAICKLPEMRKGGRRGKTTMALSVDHDHYTGEVRGLLCARCNHAIGLLREDREIVQSVIEYLEHYNPDF